MGAYAAWLSGILSDDVRPAQVDLSRTLVVVDFEPSLLDLMRLLDGVPRTLALPVRPEIPLPGVNYFRFRTGTNPIQWDDAVEHAIRQGIDTVAFLLPPSDVHGRTLLALHGLGVRRVFVPGRGGLQRWSPLRLALWRRCCTLGRTLLRRLGLADDGEMSEEQGRRMLPSPPVLTERGEPGRRLRIVYFVNSLNSGGAERQVCLSAAGQKALGHDVRVLVRQALVGDGAHYLPLIAREGIEVRQIGTRLDPAILDQLPTDAVNSLPPELRDVVTDLSGELLSRPADVLHCFVDDANVPGIIAGCLTGTPGIVLSFRNGNPSNFPGLFRPWMRPWYRAVLGRPGVCLSANSDVGARDYECWLDLSPQSIPVVRNGFVPPALPTPAEVASWRRERGIPEDVPVIAGVFRLEAEKRPLYFLECVHRLRRLIPGLRVLMAGVGSLAEQVRTRVAALGLSDIVNLLGRRNDVPLILCASDVLLLVSDWEGTPNIVLEAQYCGCVPVATDAGGTREALDAGRTGLLVGINDLAGTVKIVASLLADLERRRRMAAAGAVFARAQFSMDVMNEGNRQLYDFAACGEASLLQTLKRPGGSSCNFFTDEVEPASISIHG